MAAVSRDAVAGIIEEEEVTMSGDDGRLVSMPLFMFFLILAKAMVVERDHCCMEPLLFKGHALAIRVIRHTAFWLFCFLSHSQQGYGGRGITVVWSLLFRKGTRLQYG